jgi:UDP-2-acetamido-2-deoxy-ribo-hexuluronate aminotransferase
MVDLKMQYSNIKPAIDEALQQVLNSASFIGGKAVQNFAANLAAYLGAKHVIPCANGTDALQVAMMALGLQPGDEVITPSFTYFATCEVIALLGLKPVFVDVDRKTFTLILEEIEKAISPKTKAIVPVHLYGQSCDMEAIVKIASKYNIPVIEDNAQAIGSDYTFSDGTNKKTGTIGTIGCTSFFPSKNLGCYGDGGAMCTNDDALAERLRMIANHGQRTKYYHDLVGINSRLDGMQAAVLNVKLKKLDEYIDARRKLADAYDKAFSGLAGVTIPYRASYTKHVFHQYTLLMENGRNDLSNYLAEKEIPSMIYYPVPSHKQTALEGKGRIAGSLSNTDWLCDRVISIPMHTEMDEEQIKMITESIKNFKIN